MELVIQEPAVTTKVSKTLLPDYTASRRDQTAIFMLLCDPSVTAT